MRMALKSAADAVRGDVKRGVRLAIAACTISVAMSAGTPASATNIVTNPSFETGDLTGWTQSGNVGLSGAFCPGPGAFVADGSCSAFFGSVGSISTLMQELATTPGAAYSVSFWLLLDSDNPNSFSALFGSTPLFSVTNGAGIVNFSRSNLLATGVSTALTFGFRDDPSFIFLDAVNVSLAGPVSVSEPAGLALLGVGFAAASFGRRRSIVA